MQLADLNSNPCGGKSLRDIIGRSIGTRFYPHLGSEHQKIFWLKQFYGTSYINNNQEENND